MNQKKNQTSPDVIPPFIDSVSETFYQLCQTQVSLSHRDVNYPYTFDGQGVMAMIGLAGDYCGAVTLHIANETACRVIGRLTGMEFTGVDSDVADGVGELTNVIAGRAKCLLAERGQAFNISLPKVAFGSDMIIARDAINSSESLCFSSDVGDFMVDVTLVHVGCSAT